MTPRGVDASCERPWLREARAVERPLARTAREKPQLAVAGALVQNKEILARMEEGTPVRRVGQPDDIAGLALFLASDASNFVTGQTMVPTAARACARCEQRGGTTPRSKGA